MALFIQVYFSAANLFSYISRMRIQISPMLPIVHCKLFITNRPFRSFTQYPRSHVYLIHFDKRTLRQYFHVFWTNLLVAGLKRNYNLHFVTILRKKCEYCPARKRGYWVRSESSVRSIASNPESFINKILDVQKCM